MKRYGVLLLALVSLAGCESLNEIVVRQLFKDHGLSREVSDQIREGLERRDKQPAEIRKLPAPDFMDQG